MSAGYTTMVGVNPEPALSASNERISVFEDWVCADIRRRFGGLHRSVQPPVAGLALDPAKAGLRRWLDGELAYVTADRMPHVLGQLRGENTYGAIAEMLTVSLLRDVVGLDVTSDPLLDGLTPDFIAADRATGEPVLLGEVRSRAIAAEVLASQHRWIALAQAVAKINCPVLLVATVVDRNRSGPPTHAEREAIVQHLRKYLTPNRLALGWSTTTEGIRFEVAQASGGPTAQLVPINVYRSIDRDHVIDAIEAKVRRYRRLANQRGLPLLVVLAAEPRTGLMGPFVDSVLAGNDSVVFDIDVAGTGTGTSRQHMLRQSAAPPIFDPALSGVGFVDIRDGHDGELTIWPINGAPRALPPIPDGTRVHVMPPTGGSRRH